MLRSIGGRRRLRKREPEFELSTKAACGLGYRAVLKDRRTGQVVRLSQEIFKNRDQAREYARRAGWPV